MNEDIKEILDRLQDSVNYPKIDMPTFDGSDSEYIDNDILLEPNKCKQLLNYITNLQEENKDNLKCIKSLKEQLESVINENQKLLETWHKNNDKNINLISENECLKETNEEHRKINGQLRKENKDLKEKVDQYENPDDYTLFYMWLDTRAKDKMKQLEKENQKLKNNQVKIFNKVKDHINACKCEITEGNYCNDKHSNYWQLFKEILEDIKIDLKENDDYVYIPKWREEELLKIEKENQKLVKVIEEIKAIIKAEKDGDYWGNDDYIIGKNEGRHEILEIIEQPLTELKGGEKNGD